MEERAQKRRLATHSFLAIGLQLTALFCLQSCKTDKAAAPKLEKQATARDDNGRAVFGEGLKQRDPKIDRAAAAERDKETAVRDRVARPPEPAPDRSTRARARQSEEEKPLGSRSEHAGDKDSAPFLRYQPPGTRVGDTGETGSRAASSVPRAANSIPGMIYRWAETMLARNLDAHVSLYMPTSRDAVREEKERFLRSLRNVRHFEIHDVRIQELPDETGKAIAEFRTEWKTGNGTHTARYRLTFVRTRGDWKIESEEQLQIESHDRARESSKLARSK